MIDGVVEEDLVGDGEGMDEGRGMGSQAGDGGFGCVGELPHLVGGQMSFGEEVSAVGGDTAQGEEPVERVQKVPRAGLDGLVGGGQQGFGGLAVGVGVDQFEGGGDGRVPPVEGVNNCYLLHQ